MQICDYAESLSCKYLVNRTCSWFVNRWFPVWNEPHRKRPASACCILIELFPFCEAALAQCRGAWMWRMPLMKWRNVIGKIESLHKQSLVTALSVT